MYCLYHQWLFICFDAHIACGMPRQFDLYAIITNAEEVEDVVSRNNPNMSILNTLIPTILNKQISFEI